MFFHRVNKNCFFLWILLLAFGMICGVWPCVAEEIVYDSQGKRDPFIPLVTSAARQASGLLSVETIEDVNVEGIVYDPKNGSIVIINGSVLKEGEEAGSLKVLSVRPDGVGLSINGVESFKPLYQSQGEMAKEKSHP